MRGPLPVRRRPWWDVLQARGFEDGMVLLLGVLLGVAVAFGVWVD